jgi:SOS-response transcriptional repressor LexA
MPVLQAICDVLGVSIADMIREESGGEPISGTYSRQIVVRDMEGEKTEENIPAVAKTNPKSFALKVTDTAMESQGGISYFKDGYVLVDPDGEIESGNDYVFRIDDHLVIGRYESNGRRHIISYLNPKYPNEIIDDEPDIKGKVIGFYFYIP